MRIKKLNEIQIAITVSILLHLGIISYALAETKQHTPTIQTPLTQSISVNLNPPTKKELVKHKKSKSKKVKQAKIAQPITTKANELVEPIKASTPILTPSLATNNGLNELVAPTSPNHAAQSHAEEPTEQLKELTIIVGSQKLPLDQDMYLQSILDKIKRHGEFNYPKDAQGKSLKIKMEINKDGEVKTYILKTSNDDSVDNKLISIVQSASPFAKPLIIKQDKVIIIRTINFE